MLLSVAMLLAAALSVESYNSKNHRERVAHGKQLKIYLPKNAEQLLFSPPADPNRDTVYWENGRGRHEGRVSGTGNDRRWYIDKVTYKDEGTYTLLDYWKHEISTMHVVVVQRENYVKRVAGETLTISLEGMDKSDATLSFSGEWANVTLVRDGARVSQDLPDYFDRVRTHTSYIEIRHVNVSDEGKYFLRNRQNRMVSTTRMDLTDKHEDVNANPLLALLLLLGIPAGICCCCRKKIFKKKAPAMTLQTTPVAVHPPPGGPVGPCPPYNTPGGGLYPDPNAGAAVHPPPGPGQWNGPPPSPNPSYPPQNPGYPPQNPGYPPQNPGYPPQNPGFPPQNPGYPPQNPGYPPQNPGYPPAGQPQWNGPPPGQYPPGQEAPMGYAQPPVMYSAPPPSEEIKMANMAASPAEPLLTEKPETGAATSPGAHQFSIGGAKDSTTNFL